MANLETTASKALNSGEQLLGLYQTLSVALGEAAVTQSYYANTIGPLTVLEDAVQEHELTLSSSQVPETTAATVGQRAIDAYLENREAIEEKQRTSGSVSSAKVALRIFLLDMRHAQITVRQLDTTQPPIIKRDTPSIVAYRHKIAYVYEATGKWNMFKLGHDGNTPNLYLHGHPKFIPELRNSNERRYDSYETNVIDPDTNEPLISIKIGKA